MKHFLFQDHQYWPWPWSHEFDVHSLVANTPSLVFIKQMIHLILSGQYWDEDQQFYLDFWPCDLRIIIGNVYYLLASMPPFYGWHIVKIYWMTSSLILTFHHEIWKSVVVIIYLLGAFIVPCLAPFQERGQEILSGHLNKDQQFDFDFWPENQLGTSTL